MYSIKVDPHTHTIFSNHGFSTIGENAAYASKIGLEAIGMSEHFGPIFFPKPQGYRATMNMEALPSTIDGVRILASVEIDIVDSKGNIGYWNVPLIHPHAGVIEGMTANDPMLSSRDYSIASVHGFMDKSVTRISQNTEMYCNVLENKNIQIIGHPTRPGLKFDLKEVCQTAKAQNKMLEINDHTFDSNETITDECRNLAICCAEIGTKIVVSSDAHSAWFVGKFDRALKMLEEINFPKELIANKNLDEFLKAIEASKSLN